MGVFEQLIYKHATIHFEISQIKVKVKALAVKAPTQSQIRFRISTLEKLTHELRDLDAQIKDLATEEQRKTHAYFTEKQYEAASEQADKVAEFLNDALGEEDVVRASRSSSGTRSGRVIKFSKLPTIDLPKFDGNFENWEAFRDRFKRLVIADTELSNVERLHYLHSSLTDEASRAVRNIRITEDNFETVWDALYRRYEDKPRLVSVYVKVLLSLKSVSPKSFKDLQNLRDKVNFTLQALRNIKRQVDGYDDLLLEIVLSKLDEKSREVWQERISEKPDIPTYVEFDSFLESRIRMLQALSSQRPEPSTSKRLSAHSASTSGDSCFVCKQGHSIFKCETFRSYPLARRFQIVRSQSRCFNCLSSQHLLTECNSKYRCQDCHAKHHTLLHSSRPPASDNAPTHIQTQSHDAERSSRTLANTSALPVASREPSAAVAVIRATARIKVYSPHGRCVLVRALLDQGSEATFVSERLSKLLNLDRINKLMRVCGIGTSEAV